MLLTLFLALVALAPFYYIWCIIREVVEVRPDFSKATHIVTYGWKAVGMSLLAMIIYIAALMCSHIAAFRVQVNMRKAMMEHVMKLPMGYIESEGSGKIRKVVTESSAREWMRSFRQVIASLTFKVQGQQFRPYS